jgi:hypothetical protein
MRGGKTGTRRGSVWLTLLLLAASVGYLHAFAPRWPFSPATVGRSSRDCTLHRATKEESETPAEIVNWDSTIANPSEKQPKSRQKKKMELMWCSKDYCKDAIRERVVNEHILLNGPATGQVAYYWEDSNEGNNGAMTVATRCKSVQHKTRL